MKIIRDMRKINTKFKVWDNSSKAMIFEGFVITPTGSVETIAKHHDWDLSILQSTCLFDCKGKEIYEDDILFANDKYWKVVFSLSSGSWLAWGPGRLKGVSNLYLPKIVGNIYENPEISLRRN